MTHDDDNTVLDLSAIRFKARRYAASRGLSYADDYASYCVEMALMGRSKAHKYMLVDFRRSTFGDMRSLPGRSRSSETTGWKSHEEAPGESKPRSFGLQGILGDAGLGQIERVCLVLTHQWGMTRVEIGQVFGVDPSRISQILSKASRKARKRLKREDWA